jgi:transcriptional regulator with XRE-family HTH domain
MTAQFVTAADWIATVQARRLELGWSCERVGTEAGLGDAYFSKLMRGEKSPTLETMEKIHRALALTFFAREVP